MPKIIICNNCGTDFDKEDSNTCPYCGCVSVSEKES
jgi:rRNA maturation endonuclease Nob1